MDAVALTAAPKLAPDIVYSEQDGTDGHGPIPSPDYAWHLLAEGDSWFSIGSVPSSNLLFEMRLARWTQILNLAKPGDTLRRMGDVSSNDLLRKWLALRGFSARFSALLLSGGGNDLIDAAPDIISAAPLGGSSDDPASYIKQEALNTLIQNVQTGLKHIIDLRDDKHSKSRGAPALIHTYDYATPRNAPARFLNSVLPGQLSVKLTGPWLYEVLHPTGLDIQLQQRIANMLIDRLAEGLWALDSDAGAAKTKLPNFHVVETRNALVPANPAELGTSNDWLNEIHPTADGYRKIAARISAHVNALLP